MARRPLTPAHRLYWNESYERCTYHEAEDRFTEWLEEYQQDRAAHKKARRAHPDPKTLDYAFAAAFKGAYVYPYPYGSEALRNATRILSDMLLTGARATPEHFDDSEFSENLGEMRKLLEHLGTGRAPGAENLFDALAASGSVPMLSNRAYMGNGGTTLLCLVFDAMMPRAITCDRYPEEPEDFLAGRRHRRACFRLLARMSFLRTERALAEGSNHRFMSMNLNWEKIFPSGTIRLSDTRGRSLIRRRAEAFDASLHMMYLMVFMYRRYPWPRPQRCRVVADIAEWLQDDHTRYRGGGNLFPKDLARKTLNLALVMPGFFEALLEDRTLWLLLAASQCGEENASDEINFYWGYALQVATHGRGMGRWSVAGSSWNGFFQSRQDERSLSTLLKENAGLSTFLCSQPGRPIILDICRQRRRRVVKVSYPTRLFVTDTLGTSMAASRPGN